MRRLSFSLLIAGFSVVGAASVSAQPPMGGPPLEARRACQGQSLGAFCRFQAPHGEILGSCREVGREASPVCVPDSHGRRQSRGRSSQMRQQRAGQAKRGYTPNAPYAEAVSLSNRLTDTGQVTCFSGTAVADCSSAASKGYPGQDGHYVSRPQAFTDQGNGTVFDPATGLLWQKGHNANRLSFSGAGRFCADLSLGGRSDWRLPSIRELYSISHWQGVTGKRFFVAPAFDLAQPDESILKNDKFSSTHHVGMMGQTWSATVYADDHYGRAGEKGAFFFNFLDGRIKQAPIKGRMGLFYRCVAGAEWGKNKLTERGDGTVIDGLTGLVWQQGDSGHAGEWGAALRYCDNLTLGGKKDWRLPNVKELQSIVDYSRKAPAIDPLFDISDPAAWFWSSTTFGDDPREATYVCFGKCTAYNGTDVHGAGAQRSDPKSGTPDASSHRGGQQDEIRKRNYARCVRG